MYFASIDNLQLFPLMMDHIPSNLRISPRDSRCYANVGATMDVLTASKKSRITPRVNISYIAYMGCLNPIGLRYAGFVRLAIAYHSRCAVIGMSTSLSDQARRDLRAGPAGIA
jgi:hypothetical protein